MVEEAPRPGQGGEATGEDQHVDDLARQGRKVEPPTLVLSLRSGGKLWLSGLPTQDNLGDFPAVALQVTAFKQKPQERGGLVLPGVIQVQMPITSRGDRDGAWRTHWPTLCGGDEVLLHCMAGRQRAAALAVLVRALFENISLEESAQRISRLRHIDFQAFVRDRRAADSLYATRRSARLPTPWPLPVGYLTTARSNVHLRVAGDAPLCMFKQSAPNAEARLQGALLFGSIFEALAAGRMMCQQCMARAPASWQKI